MGCHQHDVHDVYIIVAIHVVGIIVAGISKLAMPTAGYLLDVRDVYDTITIEVAKEDAGRGRGCG